MPARVGEPAPDFTLKNHDGETVTKGDLAGRKSLVVFIPFPFTGICEAELCTIRDNIGALSDHDADVVVITCDTRPANKKWHDENGFGFPVLSDFWPHGEVAKAYGCFNDKVGAANRATYVLDGDGVVQDIIASDQLGVPREFEDYTAALATV